MKEKMKMSAPWVTFFREVKALFEEDPDVGVTMVDDTGDSSQKAINLYVDNADKADALMKLLPECKKFGGTTVNINVIPCNKLSESAESLYVRAFAGNPAFSQAISISDVFVNPITYVVFANKVVQYWNDNLGDPHGNVSTLYQDIASDVFEDRGGVLFCTEQPSEACDDDE